MDNFQRLDFLVAKFRPYSWLDPFGGRIPDSLTLFNYLKPFICESEDGKNVSKLEIEKSRENHVLDSIVK